MDKKYLGFILIIFSAFGFALSGVWSKLMGNAFAPFFQGRARSIIVIILLLIIIFITKTFRKIDKKDFGTLSLYIFSSTIAPAPLYYSYVLLPIGFATLVFSAFFAISSFIFASIYLGEKINFIKTFSLVLALLGLYIIFREDLNFDEISLLGILFSIIAGIFSALQIASSRKISHKYSSPLLTLYGRISVFIMYFIISLSLGEQQNIPNFSWDWFWLVCYAITGVLSLLFVVQGYKYITPSLGSILGLLKIPFSIILGFLLFSEEITINLYIGFILIVLAASLPEFKNICDKKRLEKL